MVDIQKELAACRGILRLQEYVLRRYVKKVNGKYPWILRLQSIKARCEDKKQVSYKWYGAKGIKCEVAWADMLSTYIRDKAYEMKHPSVDRIDSSKNYTKKNIQWLEWSDHKKKTLADWSIRKEHRLANKMLREKAVAFKAL